MTTPTLTTDIAQAARWQDDGLILVTQAEDIAITDQDSLDAATSFLGGVKALADEIHAFMDPLCEAAFASHRQLTQTRARLLEAPETASKIVAGVVVAWEKQQRLAREAAERRQREAIRKQQEDEQLRLAAEAERAGEAERAERIMAGPPPAVLVPPAVIPEGQTQAKGVTFRETWSARVTDLSALVKAVASGAIPVSYVQANQAVLDGLARALKEGMRVPGVEAVRDLNAARRR